MRKVNSKKFISIQGARVHNLKNVSVEIPRNKLVVVTGVSGSGKSSLVIDTLYAEGQRRFTESLSVYARQFLNRMSKPDVDHIHGLCPAIAVEQKVVTKTPRSTVGSMTEVNDYLRLLFLRIGKIYSPVSKLEVKKDEVEDVLQFIVKQNEGDKLFLLVAFKQHKNRKFEEELAILLQKGFSRIYRIANEQVLKIDDLISLSPQELKSQFSKNEKLFVLVDRFLIKSFNNEELHQISDSINTAFHEGEGDIYLALQLHSGKKQTVHFNNRLEADGIQFEKPIPNLFSYNNSYGACPTCEGFGQVLGVDSHFVIPDKNLSVYSGAVAPWKGEKLDWWRQQFVNASSKNNFPIHKPITELTEKQYAFLWQGNEDVFGINGFFADVEKQLYKVQFRVLLSRYRGKTLCTECAGYRLRKEALYVKINNKHIGELGAMPIQDLKRWFEKLRNNISEFELKIANRILIEIENRMNTLQNVGLGYLTLNRFANTLSGGETQRIQLTRSLSSNLTDSLYILDEPSIGLHSRDTANLIRVLKDLRDIGNTVVVVEHDEMMMREADHIIDMGPMASHLGGEVIFEGDFNEIVKHPKSLTGKYLKGELQLLVNKNVRKWNRSIKIENAQQHNLKNISVEFPLNVFCVVTGVSGSGKTSLVKQVLLSALQKITGEIPDSVGDFKCISGDVESIAKVEMVSQSPIGKSSRSNPVTYLKAYDEIRDLYSRQPLSKMRGFLPKHFSFNVEGGRCETCTGEGEQVVEMQFLADVHLVCESCKGKRFKEEVLEVSFRNKNIFDVLEMSVDEAIDFFREEKNIVKLILPLSDVGLGYIKLGQSATTLSGGEAQRVKLASFLCKSKSAVKQFFIFDEPTTGLHFHDINKLLISLNFLIEQGHSVLVVEHNIDVIRNADWIIDLGPEGGDAGGNLVFAGVPAKLKLIKESYTAQFL